MRTDFIASDVHLGAAPAGTERRFLHFLQHVGRHGRSLLLPGDLFDFWFEYGSVVPGEHFRVLAGLAELVEAGIPVTFIGGNHDAWAGAFLRDRVGLRVLDGPVRLELADRPTLAAHGDGLGAGDLRYRALKALLRSRPAILAFRMLHPELGVRLAQAVSGTQKREPEATVRGRARFLERWARAQLAEDPTLVQVVCGHAHTPAVVEVEPGRWYLNPGDWLEHDSYIRFTPEGVPELHRWQD